MFCLDDYDIDVFGAESSDEWSFLDIVVIPCNVKESAIFEDGD